MHNGEDDADLLFAEDHSSSVVCIRLRYYLIKHTDWVNLLSGWTSSSMGHLVMMLLLDDKLGFVSIDVLLWQIPAPVQCKYFSNTRPFEKFTDWAVQWARSRLMWIQSSRIRLRCSICEITWTEDLILDGRSVAIQWSSYISLNIPFILIYGWSPFGGIVSFEFRLNCLCCYHVH